MHPEPRGSGLDVAHGEHVQIGSPLRVQVVAAGDVHGEEEREVEPEGVCEEHEADADEADVHDGVDAHLARRQWAEAGFVGAR